MQSTFRVCVRFVPPETPAKPGPPSWAEISEQRSHAAKVSHRRRRASLGKSSMPVLQRTQNCPSLNVPTNASPTPISAIKKCGQTAPGLEHGCVGDSDRKISGRHGQFLRLPQLAAALQSRSEGVRPRGGSERFVQYDRLLNFVAHDLPKISLEIKPDQVPYNPYANLVRFAIQDTAACHALLASASMAWGAIFGTSMGSQSTAHKLKAIRVIGNRIQEGGEPSEMTIVSVILLWSHETLFAPPEALEAHLSGLQRMIQCRGGVSSLTPAVQILLAWTIIILPGDFQLKLPDPPPRVLSTASIPRLVVNSEVFLFIQKCHNICHTKRSVLIPHTQQIRRSRALTRLLHPGQEGDCRFVQQGSLHANCRLACLIWLLATFVAVAHFPEELGYEMERLRLRLHEHALDYSGTVIMLCELLLVNEDYTGVHDRSWFVVSIMNKLKGCGQVWKEKLATLFYRYVTGDDQSHQVYQQVLKSLVAGMREARA